MFMCTAEAPEKPAPDSATACIISAASVMPSPAPPCSGGIAMPSQPASASARWKSCGKAAVAIARKPVVVGKARADLPDRVADLLLLRREREIHRQRSPSTVAPSAAIASISASPNPASRRIARESSPSCRAGKSVPGGVPDQPLGTPRARSRPSVG